MGEPTINQPYAVYGSGKIVYGENVFVAEHAWFSLPNDQACITIGNNTQIGRFFSASCVKGISIGHSCLLAERVFITDTGHEFTDPDKLILISGTKEGQPVVIEDDVWIGVGVSILPGVHIGQHCVIGAGSVVTKDIPSYSVVAGNPAGVIKRYDFSAQSWVSV